MMPSTPPSNSRDGLLARDLAQGDPFWAFTRAMLRQRGTVAMTFVLALLSGLMLGVGVAAARPVLNSILGDHKDLPTLATDFNAGLPASLSFLRLPDHWIAALPANDPFLALVWIMGGLVVLTILGAMATFGHAYLSLTIVNRTITAARSRAFSSVLRAPLRGIVQGGSADIVARIINDSTQLAGGLQVLLGKTVLQGFKGLAAFAAAFWYDWRVAGGALLTAPLFYHVVRKLGKRIRRSSGAALEGQGELLRVTTQSLQGLRAVKSAGAELHEAGRFHRVNKRVLQELNRVRTARAIASPLTESITLVALCLMVLLAAKGIIAGKVPAVDFIMAIVCLAVAGAALKPLTALVHDIQASTPAAQRLRELVLLPREPGRERGLPRLARHHASIELRRATVTYPGRDAPALREVSLFIRHGERIAFVGPNGSGKTTALALVNRLFDPDDTDPPGQVLIDGQDLRRVKVRSVREQVGVVTQETVLFRGTVRDNITFGLAGATEEMIHAAAKQARAHDFITRLPQGYDTMVAEQGLSLSGGQRQRIAIARAILRDPAILVLDEATSMVDAESEAHIAQAIAEFSAGRTTLVVAHRLSTVINSDRIVVFDAGSIVDVGTHEQLLARCDVYQRLVRHQLSA